MPKYIRYLKNGKYEYPTVKDVGDMSKLKTNNKNSLVDAINEIKVTDGSSGSGGNYDDTEIKNSISQLEDKDEELEQEISAVKISLNNKADLTYVNQKLSEKLDKTEYEDDVQDIYKAIDRKIELHKYEEEYNDVIKELNKKVDSIDAENEFALIRTDIANNTNLIMQKVSKTEFDENVGLNKWIASKYDVDLVNINEVPNFSSIKGLNASETVEIEDGNRLEPFTGSKYIAHYFTNVYLENAKTVTLNISTSGEKVTSYMNGAKILENTGNVTMSFRKGWNTVEFLVYEHDGDGRYLEFSTKLSSLVDKITTRIGIGNKNDTRLANIETSITQTEDKISLKADKTEVTSLGNIVSDQQASIDLLNNEITTKVSSIDFNNYTKRLEDAESLIEQTSESIKNTVSKTDYDILNNRVEDAETQITQLAGEIELKAEKTIVDDIAGRLSNAESTLQVLPNQIQSKVSKDDVISTINQTAETVTIDASKINLKGKVTINDLSNDTLDKVSNDNLQIGGRNLIRYSDMNSLDGWLANGVSVIEMSDGFLKNRFTGDTSTPGIRYEPKISLSVGTYTLSLKVNTDNLTTGKPFNLYFLSGTGNISAVPIPRKSGMTTTSVTFEVTEDLIDKYLYILTAAPNIGDFILYDWIKLEKGNKATDWSPAPEDTLQLNTKYSNGVTIDSTNGIVVSGNNGVNVTANASKGFEITKNGTKVFGADTDGSIMFNGKLKGNTIEGVSGTFGNVTVNEGSFYIEDDNSNSKSTLVPATNYIEDPDFEGVRIDYNKENSDGSYQFVYEYGAWGSVGKPKICAWRRMSVEEVQIINGEPQTVRFVDKVIENIFGNNSLVVNNSNYIYQTFSMPKPNKRYCISAYFKMFKGTDDIIWNGTPRIRVLIADGNEETVLLDKNFTSVPSNGDIVRFSETFTTPSKIEISHYIEIQILTSDNKWVQVDGVQLVEGDYPTVYNPEINKGSIDGNITVKGDMAVYGEIKYATVPASFTPTRILPYENLNNITQAGMYYCPSNAEVQTMDNVPLPLAFSLLVEKHAGFKQTFTTYETGSPQTFVRNYYNGVWGEWKRIVTANNYGGELLRLSYNSGDHGYITWYEGGTRRANLGFPSPGATNLNINNEKNGNLMLITNGKSAYLNPNGEWIVNTWKGTSGAYISFGSDATGPHVQSKTIYNRTYSNSANVFITTYGTLGRTTSASKYKMLIEPYTKYKEEGHEKNILKLTPKSWYDKATVEANAEYMTKLANGEEINENEDLGEIRRHYGLIAEDLIEAGLEEFVVYGEPDENGHKEVEGIEYDRVWIMLIPIIKEHEETIKSQQKKIEELENKNGELERRLEQLEQLLN